MHPNVIFCSARPAKWEIRRWWMAAVTMIRLATLAASSGGGPLPLRSHRSHSCLYPIYYWLELWFGRNLFTNFPFYLFHFHFNFSFFPLLCRPRPRHHHRPCFRRWRFGFFRKFKIRHFPALLLLFSALLEIVSPRDCLISYEITLL